MYGNFQNFKSYYVIVFKPGKLTEWDKNVVWQSRHSFWWCYLLMSSFEIKVTVKSYWDSFFRLFFKNIKPNFKYWLDWSVIAKWTEFLNIDLKQKKTAQYQQFQFKFELNYLSRFTMNIQILSQCAICSPFSFTRNKHNDLTCNVYFS